MIRKDFYNSLQIALKGKADIDNPRGSDYMMFYKLGHINDFDDCVTVAIKRDVVTIETITGGIWYIFLFRKGICKTQIFRFPFSELHH